MMMTEAQRAMMRTHGVLVGRVLLGLLFLVSGYFKLAGGVGNFATMLSGMGLPLPIILAWVVVLLELLGGVALIVGYRVGVAAGALLVFLVLTVLFVHNPMNKPAELTSALKNLAIAGGMLYVLAYGAGEGWRLKK